MPSQFFEFQVEGGHPVRINRELVTMLIGGKNKEGLWTRIHFDKDHFAIVREDIEHVARILEMRPSGALWDLAFRAVPSDAN